MATIYCTGASGPVELAEPHDPDAILDYSLSYKPNQYATATLYLKGKQVLPTLFSGFYLECISSGISGGTEPTAPTVAGEQVSDNTVEWIAKDYNFYLEPTELLAPDVINGGFLSTWTVTDGVTIGNPVATDRSTKIWVQAVPAGVKKFTVTNHITTDAGREDDRSFILRVKDR